MIKELDSVVLTTNLPEHGLSTGDLGTVVLVHEGGKDCTVEFMTLAGKTIAVVTLLANQIRQIAKDEIAHARHDALAAAEKLAGGLEIILGLFHPLARARLHTKPCPFP